MQCYPLSWIVQVQLVLLPWLPTLSLEFAKDPGYIYPYPKLVYTGSTPLCSEPLNVVCEHVAIDVLDFTSGLSHLFPMYWVCNTKYVMFTQQTTTVLQDFMEVQNSLCTNDGSKADQYPKSWRNCSQGVNAFSNTNYCNFFYSSTVWWTSCELVKWQNESSSDANIAKVIFSLRQ